MRVMIKFALPVESGNTAIRTGKLQKVMQQIAEDLKPEAAYFFPTPTAGEGVEIGLVRHLEPRIVHPRHIPLPQNDTVSVELIPGSQIDPAICFAADLVKPDAIHIML